MNVSWVLKHLFVSVTYRGFIADSGLPAVRSEKERSNTTIYLVQTWNFHINEELPVVLLPPEYYLMFDIFMAVYVILVIIHKLDEE